jgi:hypothetical protein
MRTLLLLVILFAGITQLPAQKSFKRTTLYGEIGGSGMLLSLNYERQLSNKPGFGLYTGIGLGRELPIFSIGAKYLFQLGTEKSFIETGAGFGFVEKDLIDDKFSNVDDNSLGVTFIPCLGYRHHTPYGLMWRLNYTPAFSSERIFPYLFGISVGWRL